MIDYSILFVLFIHLQLIRFYNLLFNILKKKQMIQQIKEYQELKLFLDSSLLSHQVLHINLANNKIGDEDASSLAMKVHQAQVLVQQIALISQLLFLFFFIVLAFFVSLFQFNSTFYFKLFFLLLFNQSYYFIFFPSNQLFNQIFILQYLKSNNFIGDEGTSGLGSGLAKCINLSNLTLDLSINFIGGESASGLSSGLANCINLSNLTLDLRQKQLIYF
ncbi:transmembrane protein, putative (macronuclear) [Tetrahymena thermophila SB210]|uniref:Transmembrane protein, putative n=1 Tax=Tetrahymena thermophila (strain SB210) TaxID=312017 RepID=W7X6J3_TETTS|nr:transmembrane protein, putative [Tetrahymena thermophila SB210]EWS75000.1 transmembrane protein, putative [Tetrahymena thermophila SB210]|eukprot:XP_012652458.1 transmembrane protein, putative [Tetrahymena thermophila SB210]